MDEKKITPLDHEYDGIQEFDTPIPAWFQWMFAATVVAGLVYFLHFSLGDGLSQNAEYKREHAIQELARINHELAQPVVTLGEGELNALLADRDRLAQGKAAFGSKCATCHGDAGQGGIGPNLTDEYWIHGGKLVDIQNTIRLGVLDKGMPPWKAALPPAEIEALTVYIRSLEGTNPPNAKAPEGPRKAKGNG